MNYDMAARTSTGQKATPSLSAQLRQFSTSGGSETVSQESLCCAALAEFTSQRAVCGPCLQFGLHPEVALGVHDLGMVRRNLVFHT